MVVSFSFGEKFTWKVCALTVWNSAEEADYASPGAPDLQYIYFLLQEP